MIYDDLCLLEKNGTQYLYISMCDNEDKIINGCIL